MSPQLTCIPVSHTSLLPGAGLPSRAGSTGDSVDEGDSVGDAVGLAVAPVGPGLGLTGSGDEVGPADADDDAADDAEAVAAFGIVPDEPAVDEHPATAAVTSANPTVSSFMRVLTSFSIL